MESTNNPLRKIQLAGGFIYPEDFASGAIVRAVLHVTDRRLYALLRAHGMSSVEAWAAAFARRFPIHPDAVIAAAAVYEETSIAKRELREVMETTDPVSMQLEWQRQVGLMAVGANDLAHHLHSAYLVDYSPVDKSRCMQPSDHIALAAVMDEHARATEIEEAIERGDGPKIDWDRKFEGE